MVAIFPLRMVVFSRPIYSDPNDELLAAQAADDAAVLDAESLDVVYVDSSVAIF